MTKHVAALIGSTESVLSQERYLGRSTIPYTKIGRRVRYLRPDVIAYLAHHRVQGAA
ncbi:DNA-binding protein [Mycobacteroides abscessus]|nr:DNA-binding protein [Mycobacteroides abscessus subsp. massiliense]MBN7551924.1 DNA-binding protein [Mycobacteroides abscessus subsp. abscessus]PVA88037.1 DNA-binding protein [Mycobacteroides abscessus]QSM71726.1 DNA-binding protein [Mycobacteroides abscessus subsp. abscessus]RIS64119.1 DNA-binding protein [Mycobacteroides abscessus]